MKPNNSGKAQPLGSHESVTDAVGDAETITEPTAKYPRTGHKAARRPRLILKAMGPMLAAGKDRISCLAEHMAQAHRLMAAHHQELAAHHAGAAEAHTAMEKAAVGQVLWGE